eukprot:scaffold4124_cov267-Chaetoceros_neogracile.AAC.5
MTRAIVTKSNKGKFTKRSSPLDVQWGNTATIVSMPVEIQTSNSKHPTASCLNNLFSDLNVTRANRRRLRRSFRSNRKRSSCLVSLAKECAEKETGGLGSSVYAAGPRNGISSPVDEMESVQSRKERINVYPSLSTWGFFADTLEEEGEPVEF